MGKYTEAHVGGSAWRSLIDDSGTTTVAGDTSRETPHRQYLLITASRANLREVFLQLGGSNAKVEWQTGIPLFPGDAYEITQTNLFIGRIRAIAAHGQKAIVFCQEGR